MIRFYFNKENNGKLVRDKVVELTIAQKHIVKSRELKEQSLAKAILGKFPEELNELRQELDNNDETLEKKEIADLMTLLNSYIDVRGFDKNEIEQIEREKTQEKGSFVDGKVIEYVELNPEGVDYDFWLNHFREDSSRYIEEEIND